MKLMAVTFLIIIIYLSMRFEFRFGVAAFIATLHDILITWGLVGALQIKPSITLIAALLTIVGYSVNDTIVVFDRIRENRKGNKKTPLKAIVDVSINQSLSRTINTSLTTLISIVAMYFLGSGDIKDFAFVLIAGITYGTYSSIYIASPVILIWDSIKEYKVHQPEKEEATV